MKWCMEFLLSTTKTRTWCSSWSEILRWGSLRSQRLPPRRRTLFWRLFFNKTWNLNIAFGLNFFTSASHQRSEEEIRNWFRSRRDYFPSLVQGHWFQEIRGQRGILFQIWTTFIKYLIIRLHHLLNQKSVGTYGCPILMRNSPKKV